MKYSAVAFVWIGSSVYVITLAFSTSVLTNGMCLPFMILISNSAKFYYYIFYILTFSWWYSLSASLLWPHFDSYASSGI